MGKVCGFSSEFIKYNLNGKILNVKGVIRNNAIYILYVILYNLDD